MDNKHNCSKTLKQMCNQMDEIVRTKLHPRTGDAVKELENMLNRYNRLARSTKSAGCEEFYQDLMFNLGCAYEHTGNLKKSIEVHKALIQIKPNDHQALYTAGTNLCKLSRFEEAIPLLEKAFQLQPDNRDYRQNLYYTKRGGPEIIGEGKRGHIC